MIYEELMKEYRLVKIVPKASRAKNSPVTCDNDVTFVPKGKPVFSSKGCITAYVVGLL